MADSLVLTRDQAEQVVKKYLPDHFQSTVRLLTEMENSGYSYTPNARTYIMDISAGGDRVYHCSCFITISHPPTTDSNGGSSQFHWHTLPVISFLISQILEHTEVPIANPILDTSLSVVLFHFLLSPPSPICSTDIVPLSQARKSGKLSPEDLLLIDLQIGRLLGQLHSGVQNDWFGTPLLREPADPSYSWQESFTSLLESILFELESSGLNLPYQEIRSYLSRAIGFFLFDDVVVPSLIWFTGSEDDIYISLPSHPAAKSKGIAAILPNLGHAIWGDPLLESFFLNPPGVTPALQEAYLGSGGKQTLVFPRQKTKRLWYNLFLGLVVLKERRSPTSRNDISAETTVGNPQEEWALELIHKSIKALSNAPCY